MVDTQITKWKYRRNLNEDINNGMITSKYAYMLRYKYAGIRARKMQVSREFRQVNRLCVHQQAPWHRCLLNLQERLDSNSTNRKPVRFVPLPVCDHSQRVYFPLLFLLSSETRDNPPKFVSVSTRSGASVGFAASPPGLLVQKLASASLQSTEPHRSFSMQGSHLAPLVWGSGANNPTLGRPHSN